jgi:uncharacterized protein (DUF924 family)
MPRRRERFAPALEAIKASGVTTGQQILDAVQPSAPLDWMSLVILLDQMPRNCYRGASAAVVFTRFDPLAQGVARAALARGIPDEAPEVRWRLAYRQWFYLPLMHAEDLDAHELAVAGYARAAADVEALAAEPDAPGQDGIRARAARVVAANREAAQAAAQTNIDFERRHYDIVKRFGRYPHRNAALGRAMTADEVAYLEGGGETFGG